jgi:hypothetical protein
MSQTEPTHFKRLMRWTLISLGIHAVLIAITSIGYVLGLGKDPAPVEPAKIEAKPPGVAAPAPAPKPAADAQAAEGLPPVPKAKDADAAFFGKPETDAKKLQDGPDSRPDLDALK